MTTQEVIEGLMHEHDVLMRQISKLQQDADAVAKVIKMVEKEGIDAAPTVTQALAEWRKQNCEI